MSEAKDMTSEPVEFAAYRKTATAKACKMEVPFKVTGKNGDVSTGLAGDYLLEAKPGDRYAVAASVFEETYVPA